MEASLLALASNNDGDDYENVTRKVNSRGFKRYRAYSTRSVRQMLANSSGVEF